MVLLLLSPVPHCRCGPVERMLQLLQNVLKLGPEAFVEVGGLNTLLLIISTEAPAARKGQAARRPPQSPMAMYLATQCLERVSR